MVDFRNRYDAADFRSFRRYDGSVILYTSGEAARDWVQWDLNRDRAIQARDALVARRDQGFPRGWFPGHDYEPFLDTSRPFPGEVMPPRTPTTPAVPPRSWGPGRLGRFLPGIGLGLLIGEMLDGWWPGVGTPLRWDGQGQWEKYHDCGYGVYSHANLFAASFYPAFNCLDGQAFGDAADLPLKTHPRTPAPTDNTYIVGLGYELFGGVFAGFRNDVWFRRVAPGTLPPVQTRMNNHRPPPITGHVGLPGVNGPQEPNIERRIRRGTGTPITGEPDPWSPAPETYPPFKIEIEAVPGVGLGTSPARSPQPKPQPGGLTIRPGSPPPPPSPPRSGEKEKKVRTRGARVAIAMFRILDGLSEIADMVEAVYTSLPARLRRKIEAEERKRRGIGPRESLERPGDSMGQYGLNGADWRLAALYRHWDQINAPEAVRALITNHIEDAAYGRAYAARDRLLRRGQYRPRPL